MAHVLYLIGLHLPFVLFGAGFLFSVGVVAYLVKEKLWPS